MKYRSDQIEEGLRRALEFIRTFPRNHPIFAMLILSFLLIGGALLADSILRQEDVTPEKRPEPIIQVEEDSARDFEEAQFAAPVEEYREKQAFEKYEEDLKALEKESDTDYVDHFDGSRAEIRQREQFVQSLGAMYDLPYRGGTILAKYGKVLETSAGTKYLISIGYMESRSQAEKDWANYLRRRGDSGKYYVAEYYKIH